MKTLVLMSLLYCLIGFDNKVNNNVTSPINDQLTGRWISNGSQIQYIVDSHLVHEKVITTERDKIYDFNQNIVQVRYQDGTTAQGTFSVVKEDGGNQIVLNISGTTTSYNLIAITPTSMTWQYDLNDTYYYKGSIRKAAERAIYTEEFRK